MIFLKSLFYAMVIDIKVIGLAGKEPLDETRFTAILWLSSLGNEPADITTALKYIESNLLRTAM